MSQLPVELRRQCLEYLNVETLKTVRLINKELGSLGTEILFRTAILNNWDDGADNFVNIVQSSLNSLVRRVVINTSYDPEYVGAGQEEEEFRESFGQAIAILCDFENVDEVVVNFARECAYPDDDPNSTDLSKNVVETKTFRLEVLDFLFTAVRQAEKVKALTIKNLQDYMDKAVFDSEDFAAVRDRLTKLHLQIATEGEEGALEDNIEKPACHQGFGIHLPDIWLKPLASQLTHLSLYGTECLWGVWPIVDLRQVPSFPQLKSLSLGNFTVAYDWQIEWILSHGPTLQELLLDDCPMIVALKLGESVANTIFPDLPRLMDVSPGTTDVPEWYFKNIDLRWHDIFDRFRIKLLQLQHFSIGSGHWANGTAFEERYQLECHVLNGRYFMFDCGVDQSPWVSMEEGDDGHGFRMGSAENSWVNFRVESADLWVDFPQCRDEDERALVMLLDAVNARTSANG
ncbi:hypothetical protein N0V83_009812 [Neocucurbitaria cava]|uniref:F-box domain-containing protein n=1 Tax=Neocucurbitaria cava TaxID=798079 RepID=A0A9W8XZ79_9PLEO|nr:hypothetical protein N0V83_009812 [Neocucurbitaria cava]